MTENWLENILPDRVFVIWLNPEAGLFCVVDYEDYHWALQWTWSAHPNSTGLKFYATRSTRLNGRAGKQTRVYMHKEILKRAGHKRRACQTMGDHRDGDSLNNRRYNLRWATPKQNRKNIRKD